MLFTSRISSPSCKSPLASAVPPLIILAIITDSPSFLTVAPRGSVDFSGNQKRWENFKISY